ncbi:MAG: hypothetical protein K6U74_10670, partial [Firmicutes bacterium]|nr:hypothetical protein [Bacillota bacterium]
SRLTAKEKEAASLKQEVRALKYRLDRQVENSPTVGYLLGLYEKIAAQEEEIRALRRLGLAYLSALQKKNAKLAPAIPFFKASKEDHREASVH